MRIVAFNKSFPSILLVAVLILFIRENSLSTAAFETGHVNRRETINKGNFQFFELGVLKILMGRGGEYLGNSYVMTESEFKNTKSPIIYL